MKKMFSLALGIVMVALSAMAGERSFLQVTFASGAEAVIYGTGALKMAQGYDPQKGTFVLTLNEATYEFSDLTELRFLTKAQGIGQTETTKDKLSYRLYDRRMVISGNGLSGVAVYAMDGKAVPAAIERGEGDVTVDFTSCTPGVYIIKTNSNSIKVSIR